MKIFQTITLLSMFLTIFAFSACGGGGGSGGADDDGTAGYSAGDNETYTVEGVSFIMVFVPGGKTFPTGVNDDGTATVTNAYWIGETEVTYELWSAVRTWAMDTAVDHDGDGLTKSADGDDDVYSIAQPGTKGDGTGDTVQHPVANISWRDAMVWCNALTELYNANNGSAPDLDLVYYYDSSYTAPIRDSLDDNSHPTETPDDYTYVYNPNAGGFDNPYVNTDAAGFRLQKGNEWELAARYIDGNTWLYGDHVSGDLSGACFDDKSILGDQSLSTLFGNYAVYWDNSGISTAEVKSKIDGHNALGLYDMSGNVYEWCYDWAPGYEESRRMWQGGSFQESGEYLRVGVITFGLDPFNWGMDLGFRIAKIQ